MSVYDHSYGTPADVAALVPRYTDSTTRVFNSSTRPTIQQVETYIDRISAILNVLLAEQGFAIPVVQQDAAMALAELVIESVIDLCHAANSAGRFFSDRELRGQSPMKILRNELADWIETHAAGFENLGATRSTSNAEQIGYRGEDEGGDSTFPIFQRSGFGNEFTDWDS